MKLKGTVDTVLKDGFSAWIEVSSGQEVLTKIDTSVVLSVDAKFTWDSETKEVVPILPTEEEIAERERLGRELEELCARLEPRLINEDKSPLEVYF